MMDKKEIGFIKKVNAVFQSIQAIEKSIELFSPQAIAILDKVSKDDIKELKALYLCLDELNDIFNNLTSILQSKEFIKNMDIYKAFIEQKFELIEQKEKLVKDLSVNIEQTFELIENKKGEIIDTVSLEVDKRIDKATTINNKTLNENIILVKEHLSSELKKYAFVNGDETENFKVATAQNENEAVNKQQLDLVLNSMQENLDSTIKNLVQNSTNQALKEANGWFKDSSSGIIFQWGLCKIWDYSKIHYFPISFPNQALNITFGFNDYEGIPRGGIKNRSSFVVYPSRSTRSNFYYLAIGY